jgi:outer membrane protein assembly factor BamB
VGTANVSSLLPAWSAPVDVAALSSPVVTGGLVYVSCPGGLCAYEEHGGRLQWRAPAVHAGGAAVVSGTVVFTDNGVDVVAVDAVTGAARWRTTVSSGFGKYIESFPVGDADRVFVGTEDDRLVALSLTTGAVLWSSSSGPGEPERQVELWNQPALVNGTLYVSQQRQLRAVRASDGAVLWRTPVDANFDNSGTPTIVGSTVYVSGQGTLNSVDPPAVDGYPLAGCGGPVCQPTVSTPMTSAFGAMVSFPDDPTTLYGLGATKIVAFNALTGQVRWTSTPIYSATDLNFPEVVGANGVLYLSDTATGQLLAFTEHGCASGVCAPIWSAQTDSGDGGSNYGDPVIADGTIFVIGNALYAYRLPATIAKPPALPAAPAATTARTRVGAHEIHVNWTRVVSKRFRVLAYELQSETPTGCPTAIVGTRFTSHWMQCASDTVHTRVRVRAISPVGPSPWSTWSNNS